MGVHLDVSRFLKRLDRIAHGQVLRQGEDLRVHDAAGGPVVLFEKLLDVVRLPLPHEFQDARGEVAGKSVDQRRRVVGRYFGKEPCQLFRQKVHEQRHCDVPVELGDGVHCELA